MLSAHYFWLGELHEFLVWFEIFATVHSCRRDLDRNTHRSLLGFFITLSPIMGENQTYDQDNEL